MGRTREGYRPPEERTFADLMVGHRVVLQHAVGPDPDPGDPDRRVKGSIEAVTGAYWLHAVSHQGVEVSRSLSGEALEILLVPWASVLMLNGLPRGELEEEARGKFAVERRELLGRLGEAREGDTTLGLDARRYLSLNPKDGEVREALERLPRETFY
jgi:hypothetical protein